MMTFYTNLLGEKLMFYLVCFELYSTNGYFSSGKTIIITVAVIRRNKNK